MRLPTFLGVTTLLTLSVAHAQSISPPTGQKTMAATLNVHVFPGAGQATAQQSHDESECYNWSAKQTGSDPFELDKQAAQQQQQAAQQQQQAQQATAGAGVKGAVRGAAGGAVVGGIAGDAGKGAAIGAGVGAVASRAKGRAKAQESQQKAQQSQSDAKVTAAKITDFKKAFSACLEAKKYTVKF